MPPPRKPDLAPEGVFGAQILYPITPRGLEDLLFSELWDGRIPGNERWEYDTPHPDPKAWPHHVLVHVEPGKGQGQQTRWYAIIREKQDYYNFESAQADVAGTRFNVVIRHYVHRRDTEFKWEVPKQGDPMPNVPVDKFAPGVFILGESGQTKIQDEHLDSVFVAERLVYIERAVMHDINTDNTLGVGVLQTTTLYYRGETVPNALPAPMKIEDLVTLPLNAFWGAQPTGEVNEQRQMSDNWYAVVTTSSRDAAFQAYVRRIPSKVDLKLPDVMAAAPVVIWNKADGAGNFKSEWGGQAASSPGIQLSLNGSEQANVNASCSIQPDLSLNIVSHDGRDIPSVSVFFFMKPVSGEITEAAFLARLTLIFGAPVKQWPSFHPTAHSIVLKGQKVSVSAQASASASMSGSDTGPVNLFSEERNFGTGTDKDTSTMMGTTHIPATIHPTFTILTTANTATVQAVCDVGWVGWGIETIVVDGITYTLKFPTVAAKADTGVVAASGLVSPTTLPATVPDSIPNTGLYVTDVRIEPVDSQWFKCYAEVFNAANILPPGGGAPP